MEAANQQYVITFVYFNRSPEKKAKSTMVMHFLLNIDIKCDSSRDIDHLILHAVCTFENQAISKFRVRHLFSIAFMVVVSVQLSSVSAIFMILQTIQHVG